MPYASATNAVLIDGGCNYLQDLSVLLKVTEDIATTDGKGWSLQLNCYPPAGRYCQTSQVNWLQYIVYVQGGNLLYEIQYWALGASTWPPGTDAAPSTTPWLPCWANDYFAYPFASINGDTLPRGSKLQIALGTDAFGGVTSVIFSYTDPDGNDHAEGVELQAVHPIVACELNLVGPGNFANANFTQGVTNSRGIIYYSVSSGQLSVQNGGPGAACGEQSAGVTGETSNMVYSDINGAPASTVTQTLQQPVSCGVNSLFASDQARLSEMQRLRDVAVSQHRAGQWLLEVLDRYSADLALLAASDDGLAQVARDLLVKAADTAGHGRVFDGATVDEGLRVLGQASCKLPPSMHGIGQAGATLLESLRGKTLEEGLTAASKTILPRFQPPPG